MDFAGLTRRTRGGVRGGVFEVRERGIWKGGQVSWDKSLVSWYPGASVRDRREPERARAAAW